MPLFEAAQLAERFDLAIMSTKGMSVTASRRWSSDLCATHDIPLLVLHDFDMSGFSIAGTLQRSTRRYTYRGFKVHRPRPAARRISTGSRRRTCTYTPATSKAAATLAGRTARPRTRSTSCCGKRVELNAFASDEFVAFIERKLDEHRIGKVIPDEETLRGAYRRARATRLVNDQLEAIVETATEDARTMPIGSNLAEQVRLHPRRGSRPVLGCRRRSHCRGPRGGFENF